MVQPAAQSLEHDSKIKVVVNTPMYIIGTYENLYLILWRAVPNIEAMRDFIAQLNTFAAQREKVMVVTILLPQTTSLPNECRQYLAVEMKKLSEVIAASSVVIEGVGFWAATMRAVVTGLILVSRQPFPHRAFGTPTDAGRWMALSAQRRSGLAVNGDELGRAISDFRSTSASAT